MKKIILLLSSLAFVFYSCDQIGIQGLGFDYEIDFNVPIEGPVSANTPISYKATDIQNTLDRELDQRGIQFIENIQLSSISLFIPETSSADFSFLSDLSATLVVDGERIPLKFVDQIDELAAAGGKSIRISIDRSTPDFAQLRDAKELGLVASMTLNKDVEESFEINAKVNTKIYTSFIE